MRRGRTPAKAWCPPIPTSVRQAFAECIAGASLSEIVAKLPLPPDRKRRLAKIDAERAKIEGAIAEENRAEEQARAAADPARRRELLASVRGMRAAWGAASPAERRRIVELLCERAELVTGEGPRMVWRTVEELLGSKRGR